jgi:hypothetical protein
MSSTGLVLVTAVCSGLAAAGLYWFYYGFSHLRSIDDTPTSRIASAAQGYAELCGEAFKLDGVRDLFAHDGVPCLWYRNLGENKLEAAADGTQNPFGVRDESGYAVVLPYHAQVESVHRYRWKRRQRQGLRGGSDLRRGQALYTGRIHFERARVRSGEGGGQQAAPMA